VQGLLWDIDSFDFGRRAREGAREPVLNESSSEEEPKLAHDTSTNG
jgi:hypothetical protein